MNKRLIFTVTSGRSGTFYLAYILGKLPGVVVGHEPKPGFHKFPAPQKYAPGAAAEFLAQRKLPAIEALPGTTYVETSHYFCKGFVEPMLDAGIVPDLILLRRDPRKVAQSWFLIGGRPKHMLQPDEPNFLPAHGWEAWNHYQLCYWYALEAHLRMRHYAALITAHGGKIFDTSLDDLVSGENYEPLLKWMDMPEDVVRARLDDPAFFRRKVNEKLTKKEMKGRDKELAGLDVGALEEQVRRDCGLSAEQLEEILSGEMQGVQPIVRDGGKPRIFVNIASYRDPECQWTVKDMFAKAAHPQRIFAGICLQVDPNGDAVCRVQADYPQQVRICEFDARESKGANWARHQAQLLWQGEDYILQVDSHMRFERGWDEALIAMLEACPSRSAALSTYVPRYTPPDNYTRTPGNLLRIRVHGLGEPGHPQLLHLTKIPVSLADTERCGLYASPFYIANFLFCRVQLLQEVPFDPHIRFWGDEISFAARLWTHGYDIYQPDRVALYHYWRRDELAAIQPYRRYDEPQRQRAVARLKHVLGFEESDDSMALAELERYGLGTVRTLDSLWEFAGIDWQNRTVSDDAKEGRWNMNAKKSAGKKSPQKTPVKVAAPALPRIFVQIASYRDPDCQWTVKDMFEKAAHPERIFAGIVWQTVRSEDAICFKIPYPRPGQVRVTEIDAKKSKGVCWARSLAQKLWQGEEFTLQIDSHMRFEPGWDDMLLDMWRECATPKAVLTCYAPGFTPPDKFERDWIFGMAAKHFDPNGICLMHGKPAFDAAHRPAKPIPGAFVSANMLFGPSSMIQDVPYDPHLYFFGEEISLGVRLWTSGYDIFHPNKLVIFHDWDRGKRPTHFSDHKDWGVYNDVAFARVRHMLGTQVSTDPKVLAELGTYGLGKARSLADFQRFSGIDFAAKTLAAHTLEGIFSPPATGALPRIFVQIASYRDRECQWTVKDLFEKAAHPERISVGICWQFDPVEDQECFQIVTRPEQVRIFPVDWRESEGVCWARHQTQQLWDGEEYSLQIDAHMRFLPGWDELMIAELDACDAQKPVLSSNPASYTPPNDLQPNPPPAVRRVMQFTPEGNIRGKGEALDRVPPRPLNGAFISGGFVFARSSIISEVPYDPYLYFDQEEITYAARLYTHGWDIFSSRRPLLYHLYNVGKESVRPLHWKDLKQEDEQKMQQLRERGIARFNHMTGFAPSAQPEFIAEIAEYGFGTQRTLAQYEDYCSIDFKRKVASEKAMRGLFIRDLSRYRDNPIRISEQDNPMRKSEAAAAQVTAPARKMVYGGALEPGDFVPMFEVTDTFDKNRAIEVYAGKHTLLYFLPARDAEYAAKFLNQLHATLSGNALDVWTVFILDDTVEALKALRDKIGTRYTLWADPDRTLAMAFGLTRGAGDALPPAGYVLSPNLRITHRHLHLNPAQMVSQTVEDGRRALAAFRQKTQPQRVVTEMAPALIVSDAFSPELCARCIESFRTGHTFEGTVGTEEKRAYRPNNKIRTDHVIDGELLAEVDDKLSRSLFPEIKKIFGFDVTFREYYKVGSYTGEKGGFFRQHRDNFDPPLGYRRIAMTLHLNDDYEGGGLRFPEYDDHIYRPAVGSAITFSCATLHEARPVTKGERFVLVGFFHGDQDEAYRRHYVMGKGLPAKIHEFTPTLHGFLPMKQSRDYYSQWLEQQGNPLVPVQAPQHNPVVAPMAAAPSARVNLLLKMHNGHQARKVFESKQAIIFDDFLPEDVYKKVYEYALETDYEYINTKGKITRAWHIHDGFPLRSLMNAFYHADDAKKPKGDYVYPTRTPLDLFIDAIMGAQPHTQHLVGKKGTDWQHFSVTGWIYPHGTGLAMHDDGSGIYSGAFVYFLNPTWRAHWGGLNLLIDEEGNRRVHEYRNKNDQMAFYKRKWLHANHLDELVLEDGFAKCIFPKRNRIVFIANDAYHMVTRVNEQAGDNMRMSLAGFFDKPK